MGKRFASLYKYGVFYCKNQKYKEKEYLVQRIITQKQLIELAKALSMSCFYLLLIVAL